MSLSIQNLWYYLARTPIIENFSLDVKKGDIITLFGPSGCGKTTLLKLISGILEPQEGAIKHNKAISYLFQEHRLFDCLSVYDNIALVMENPDKRQILDSLASVGLDQNDAIKYPCELSGGMRARVAFIRALAHKSDILLLDEPFSGLDFKMREILIDKVRALKDKAVILVTHDAYEACMISNEILFLSNRGLQIQKRLKIERKDRSLEYIKELFKSEFKGRLYFD